MNMKKILAAVAAAAVAVSMTAVNAFAAVGSVDTTNYMKEGDANGTVYIRADKEGDPNWTADTGVALADVYGVKYYVEFNADEVANAETWIGGGMGANSQSTGWLSNEWGRADKAITADLENGTITWLSDKPVFTETDTYCQFWLQTWGGTVTIKAADILGADGNVIDAAPAAEEAPAEEEAAAEETTEAVEEEAVEEVAAEEVAEEAVEEEAAEEVVEEAAPEADASTEAAATGNVAVASIAAVMAIAGAAAIASKKRN